MFFRSLIFPLLALVLCGLALPGQAAEDGVWEVVRVNGNDYVTGRSMKRFYGFQNYRREGKKVTLETPKVEVKLTIGEQDCYMNGVKFVFTHPVIEKDNLVLISRIDLAKLIDPVLRPNYIQNAGAFRTVILDPGHGGKDPGAKSQSGGSEAAYTMAVARRLKAMLEAQHFKVVMTRDKDNFLSLQKRVDIANAVQERAIFISIHFNSGSKHASGIETFTLSPPGVAHYGRGVRASDKKLRAGNLHDSANIALATAIHGSVLRRLAGHPVDRGIKRARFNVLSGVEHPAILLEGGFMSHAVESKSISTAAYQDALARGIVEAIAKYRYAVSAKPTPYQVRP